MTVLIFARSRTKMLTKLPLECSIEGTLEVTIFTQTSGYLIDFFCKKSGVLTYVRRSCK